MPNGRSVFDIPNVPSAEKNLVLEVKVTTEEWIILARGYHKSRGNLITSTPTIETHFKAKER